MADLGTLALGTFTNVVDTAIQGTDPVLELIASTDDADYVYDAANTTHTGTARFALGDTPSDLGRVDTLSVQLRYAWQTGTQVNTWNSLTARVFKSDGTTPLTDSATVASNITTTTITNSSVVAFTGVDTNATKADWDGAVVHISWGVTKSMAGDTLQKRVYAAQLTGTYSLANAALTGTAAQVFANSSSAVGNGALSGTAAQVFANSSALSARANFAGTAAQVFANTGALVAKGALAGASTVVFTVVGVIRNAPVIEYLRPDATVGAGNWTTDVGGTDLHTVIDEVSANDADYMQSDAHPANSACTVALSNPSGTVVEPVVVRYRYYKSNNENTMNLRVRLLEGVTEIAAWDHNNIGTGVVEAAQTLTAGQFAAVTNWNDVRLSAVANPA